MAGICLEKQQKARKYQNDSGKDNCRIYTSLSQEMQYKYFSNYVSKIFPVFAHCQEYCFQLPYDLFSRTKSSY